MSDGRIIARHPGEGRHFLDAKEIKEADENNRNAGM